MKKPLAAILVALASLLLLAVRHLEREDAISDWPSIPASARPAGEVGRRPRPPETDVARTTDGTPSRTSSSLGDPELDRQVAAVIESMDRTGRPPAGIAQGGRKSGKRGLFQNAEGRLPAEPPGYYTETDVWPPGAGGRGTRRLIFGRGGEVYFTADHYRTFARVR
jgi:guanyl-specific ribonuclease Sa